MSKHGLAAILAVVFYVWIRSTGAEASLGVLALLWVLVYACVGMGELATALIGWHREPEAGALFSFVTGYVLISVLLFFFVLVLPFGVGVAFTIVLGGVGVAHIGWRRQLRAAAPPVASRQPWADVTALALAILAATIWTQETRSVIDPSSDPVVFKAWQDLFYHARMISMFGQSHGRETLLHISDASQTLAVYHYATYMLPAVIHKLGHVAAVNLYSSVLYAGAVVMGGLGAYLLIRSLFGAWPAVAAVVAVVFWPDASFLGLGNKHQSYYFQAFVNVAMPYGLACLAVSWAIMIRACKTGALKQVIFAYLLGVILVFFKAHLFFANSFLLMLYPVFMYSGLRRPLRVGLAAAFTALFVSVFAFFQQFDSVPHVALDGYGVHVHFRNMNHYTPPGGLKDLWKYLHGTYRATWLVYPLGMVYIIMYSLGLVFVAFCLALMQARRSRLEAHAGWVLSVFLLWLMYSLFLSPDTRKIGTMDELIHRPFVWAYYLMAAWSAGVLYRTWVGVGVPRAHWGGALGLLALASTVWLTALQSVNAQVFPIWREGGYRSILAFDRCALNVAHFIRDHREAGQLFQASDLDSKYFFTAQSETQIFAGRSVYGPTRSAPKAKLEALAEFMKMNDEAAVLDYVRHTKLTWFIKEPPHTLQWPETLSRYRIHECGGFQLYRFDPSTP